ncbi:hypothetical protein KKC94_04280 [Patescibacteria group bacterium]|nr:hypothetical protein [Patescibacteria group bacterium]
MAKNKTKLLVGILALVGVVIIGGYYFTTQTNMLQGQLRTVTTPKLTMPTESANDYSIASGTLSMQQPAAQVSDQLSVTGAKDVFIGTFKVKATVENFTIKKLTLTVPEAAADSVNTVIIEYPTDFANPSNLDGSEEVSLVNNTATFSALSFAVPKNNDNVIFEVYVTLSEHSDKGGSADTGDAVSITVDLGENAFEAIGQDTGKSMNGGDLIVNHPLTTNNVYVFKSVPTITTEQLGNGNHLIMGLQTEVFRFKVAANNGGDIALAGLKLRTAYSGILEPTNWEMYLVDATGDVSLTQDKGEGIKVGEYVYMNISDDISNWTGTGVYAAQMIGAGDYETFAVLATIIDNGIDSGITPTISVQISADTTALHNKRGIIQPGSRITGPLAEAGFIWTDQHGSGKYHNGYNVQGLPTGFTTLTQ